MIISFSVSNFRSIRDEQTLEFTANSSNSKTDNLIHIDDKDIRLLKSIVIYGANAAGKTNLIRAFYAFRKFVLNSTDLKKGDPIPEAYYDPFLLDEKSGNLPTTFKVAFIGVDSKKYVYETKYKRDHVEFEKLVVYDSTQPSTLFLRENAQESVKVFEKFVDQKVDVSILANQLFLTKVGNSPNEQIGKIYLYFKDIEIWNAANTTRVRGELFRKILDKFSKSESDAFQRRLIKLINLSDTRIDSLVLGQGPTDIDIPAIEGISDAVSTDLKAKVLETLKYQLFGVHKIFDNSDNHTSAANFEFFRRESNGTQGIFAIGGLILSSLLKPNPGIILFDEFDNSLHPELCRFLIELFHNPIVNRNNSQIAFATHETQLLDKDLFRKDQIWFAEKDKYGRSEFFSVADFGSDGNLREGISFDKWYKLGKFGGIPHIKKTEFFAEYES
jgi:AAA15 family ATPase/GTPase